MAGQKKKYLADFLSEESISLELKGKKKEEIIKELLTLLSLKPGEKTVLFRTVMEREKLGSTAIGNNVAIPHCHSVVVNKIHIAFGRKEGGIKFGASDRKPTNYFFLIIAPHDVPSGNYLAILSKIAQFCKSVRNVKKLGKLNESGELIELFREMEI